MVLSCVSKPLFTGDMELYTMAVVAFPSLHVHLGIPNSLIDALESRWPEIVMWFHSLHIKREEYFGGNFEVRERESERERERDAEK